MSINSSRKYMFENKSGLTVMSKPALANRNNKGKSSSLSVKIAEIILKEELGTFDMFLCNTPRNGLNLIRALDPERIRRRTTSAAKEH